MTRQFLTILALACLTSATFAADLKPIELDQTYKHDKFGTQPTDIVREFRAYTVSFDGLDDDNGDGNADLLGIPEFVAYEIKKYDDELPAGPDRPSDWITDDVLHMQGIVPNDDTYHFANTWRAENPDSPMLGHDRGHMCMKQHAWRLGEAADWNTHTLLNCCPQASNLNQGIWLDLEYKTAEWADEYESVWIICGPVFLHGEPILWLGQDGEVPAAVPDAFFKLVIKEAMNGGIDVLAFIYPQNGIDYKVKKPKVYDHTPYLTSVDVVEALTGLDFMTNLDDDLEATIERVTQTELWN